METVPVEVGYWVTLSLLVVPFIVFVIVSGETGARRTSERATKWALGLGFTLSMGLLFGFWTFLDVSFMVSWWATVGLMGLSCLGLCFVIAGSRSAQLDAWLSKVLYGVLGLTGVAIILGIWLPIAIPGLY